MHYNTFDGTEITWVMIEVKAPSDMEMTKHLRRGGRRNDRCSSFKHDLVNGDDLLVELVTVRNARKSKSQYENYETS